MKITIGKCDIRFNILAHAQMEDLEIGSRCGGHGICGGDKIKIIQGAESLSEITDREREHLSESELKSNHRLACQAFPNSECELIYEIVRS